MKNRMIEDPRKKWLENHICLAERDIKETIKTIRLLEYNELASQRDLRIYYAKGHLRAVWEERKLTQQRLQEEYD